MSEKGSVIEFIVAPSNLSEFLDRELEREREVLEIDKYNLEVIRQDGDDELKALYGGANDIEKLIEDHEAEIERLEEAKDALGEGDDSLARIILDKRIEQAGEFASRNFEASGPSPITEMFLTEMNLLRSLRDKLQPTKK